MTVGSDGLTDAERLDLKVKSETHNRIAENTAAVKENTVALGKLTLEFQNWQTRLAIDRRTPTEQVEPKALVCKDWTRKDGSVKKGCGAPVKWGQMDGKSRLLNPDGTMHGCGGRVT